jgi:hypothetical protein
MIIDSRQPDVGRPTQETSTEQKSSILRRIGNFFMSDSPETSYAKFQKRQAHIARKIATHGIKNVKGIVVVPTSLGRPIGEVSDGLNWQNSSKVRDKAELNAKIEELRQLGISEKDLKVMTAFRGVINTKDIIPGGGAAPSRIARDRRAPRFKSK